MPSIARLSPPPSSQEYLTEYNPVTDIITGHRYIHLHLELYPDTFICCSACLEKNIMKNISSEVSKTCF